MSSKCDICHPHDRHQNRTRNSYSMFKIYFIEFHRYIDIVKTLFSDFSFFIPLFSLPSIVVELISVLCIIFIVIQVKCVSLHVSIVYGIPTIYIYSYNIICLI